MTIEASSSRQKLLGLGLILVFISLSLASISRFSPWHDESYSATLIEGSYSDVIHRTALDVHPPLYYLALKTWSSVFGSSIITLRLFSVVCMTGAVFITWRLMSRQYGQRLGLIALTGMATGPFLIRYSQEMRMYGFGSLLAMSATYILWRLTQEKLSRRTTRLYTTLYILLMTAAVYSHYFLIFLLAAHFCFVLVNYAPKKLSVGSLLSAIKTLPGRWWATFILPLLFFAPWLPTVADQFSQVHGSFWIGPLKVDSITSTIINFLLFRQQWELSNWTAALGIVILLGVSALLIYWYRSSDDSPNRAAKRLSAYLLVVPLMLLIIVSLPPLQPAYQDRYLSFYAPILYGSFALCIAYWWQAKKGVLARLPALIMVPVIVAGVVFASLLGNNQGWRPEPHFSINKIADFINQNDPRAEVISTSLWTFFDAHIVIGKHQTTRLYTPDGVGRYGNGSAVYNRYDLQIRDLKTVNGPTVWILEESGRPSIAVPPNWQPKISYQIGYARAILYKIY